MNSLSIFTLKVLRKLYAKVFGKFQMQQWSGFLPPAPENM